MTTQLRQGIETKAPSPTLSDEGECDEVYIVAGYKGHPDEVATKGVPADDGDAKAHGDVARLRARNR